MLCEMLGNGEAVVLLNISTISQKGKKLQSKKIENSTVNGYTKL